MWPPRDGGGAGGGKARGCARGWAGDAHSHAHLPPPPPAAALQTRPADFEQQYAPWVAEVLSTREANPLNYPQRDDVIMPQWAIEVRGGGARAAVRRSACSLR